jgi:hypothetical protein
MKQSLHFLLLTLLILLFSCQPEEITPNTPPPTPNPTPTDTTGTDTATYTSYMLFEMFNNSTGQNLKNTVDSITFDNQATNYHKTWLPGAINWHDVNNYGCPGNYTKCYIPTPTYGDQVQTIVYFNSGEQKNCLVTYNDLAGGSSVSIITSFGTNTYTHTRAY